MPTWSVVVVKGLSVLGLLMTLLPMMPVQTRWVRFFDFPRMQIMVLLVTMAGAQVAVALYTGRPGGWLWAIPLLAAALYQGYWIYPFTPFAPYEMLWAGQEEANTALGGQAGDARAGQDRTLKLLVYNVRMENDQYESFIERIKEVDPDVILANEIDERWARALESIHERYPHRLLEPLDNTYGMGLYSRLTLENDSIERQVQEDVPSVHATLVLPSGDRIDFHGIHPRPPDLHTDTEARDAELVVTGLRISDKKRPALIAGDLNDVAWSRTSRLFKRLSGMIDPRVGRQMLNTYSVFVPGIRYPLDHIFTTTDFTLVGLRRLDPCGSDHFPVFIELRYSPRADQVQDAESPDSEDAEQARELIESGREAGDPGTRIVRKNPAVTPPGKP